MTTIRKQASERVVTERKPKIWTPGQIVLMIVILIFSLTCLLPFVNVAAVSFSSKSAILRGDVSFWPVEFNTTAYEAIFSDKSMIHSLVYTISITVAYTLFSMIMTILMAYPLTKGRLRGRKFFNFLALFTMYFSGGTIPIYLNIKELGLLDTPWSLILPGMLSTYNMIILKSFFSALPKELEEAAIMQLKLYHIIKGSQAVDVAALEGGASTVATSVSESIEPATIIFATLPILVVYPFVQRYFVAGVTIGAVKG